MAKDLERALSSALRSFPGTDALGATCAYACMHLCGSWVYARTSMTAGVNDKATAIPSNTTQRLTSAKPSSFSLRFRFRIASFTMGPSASSWTAWRSAATSSTATVGSVSVSLSLSWVWCGEGVVSGRVEMDDGRMRTKQCRGMRTDVNQVCTYLKVSPRAEAGENENRGTGEVEGKDVGLHLLIVCGCCTWGWVNGSV